MGRRHVSIIGCRNIIQHVGNRSLAVNEVILHDDNCCPDPKFVRLTHRGVMEAKLGSGNISLRICLSSRCNVCNKGTTTQTGSATNEPIKSEQLLKVNNVTQGCLDRALHHLNVNVVFTITSSNSFE